MRSSVPCSKLRACAGLRNCFEPAGIFYRNGNGLVAPPTWCCGRLKPPGSVHINASSQNWKSPPFTLGAQKHGERHYLKSPCLGLRRRRDRRSDPHPRLVCNPARKHREGAWPKHKGFGRALIEGALPYSHGAETRYELDEMGLRCSIALPLGMDGRQERL